MRTRKADEVRGVVREPRYEDARSAERRVGVGRVVGRRMNEVIDGWRWDSKKPENAWDVLDGELRERLRQRNADYAAAGGSRDHVDGLVDRQRRGIGELVALVDDVREPGHVLDRVHHEVARDDVEGVARGTSDDRQDGEAG